MSSSDSVPKLPIKERAKALLRKGIVALVLAVIAYIALRLVWATVVGVMKFALVAVVLVGLLYLAFKLWRWTKRRDAQRASEL